MPMEEKEVFIERGTLKEPEEMKNYSCRAELSYGPIKALKCTACHQMFMVIHIDRVPELSGEYHYVAIQLDKENISACPRCSEKK